MIREEIGGGAIASLWTSSNSAATVHVGSTAGSTTSANLLLPRTSSSFFMGKGSLMPGEAITGAALGNGIKDAAAAASTPPHRQFGGPTSSLLPLPSSIASHQKDEREEREVAARWRVTRDESVFSRVQMDFALDFTAMQRLVRAFREEMRKGCVRAVVSLLLLGVGLTICRPLTAWNPAIPMPLRYECFLHL